MANVILNRVTNFSQDEATKLQSVIPYIQLAVNSKEFLEACVSFQYEKNNSYMFGHTGEQIYNCIMNGNEKLSGVSDYEIDIDLTIYSVPFWKSGKSTIGYTYPTTLKTWINRKFFRMFSIDEIAGNIMHEYMHKLGYGHSFSWTRSRDKSVPYAIGYMIRDIVKKLMEGEK